MSIYKCPFTKLYTQHYNIAMFEKQKASTEWHACYLTAVLQL